MKTAGRLPDPPFRNPAGFVSRLALAPALVLAVLALLGIPGTGLGLAPALAQPVLVSDFESPAVPANGPALVVGTGGMVDGWTVESGNVLLMPPGGVPAAGASGQCLNLNGTEAGTVRIPVATEPGARYEIFLGWGTNGERVQGLAADVLWNGLVAGRLRFELRATNLLADSRPVFPSPESHGRVWAVVEGTGRDTLSLRSLGGGPTGFFVDGVSVSRVADQTPLTPPGAYLVPQGPENLPAQEGLVTVPDRIVDEGFPLHIQMLWPVRPDQDQFLFVSLVHGPPGAQFIEYGRQLGYREWWFHWTPSETDGGTVHHVEIHGTAFHFPGQRWAVTFPLHVRESSVPPVIDPVRFVRAEGELLEAPLSGHDSDLPAQTLRWALRDAPEGASLDPSTGILRWTPGEADGPKTNLLRVALIEEGPHGLVTETNLPVVVTEVNQPPRLRPSDTLDATERRTLQFPVPGEDPDRPDQRLTYTLLSGPDGLRLEPTTGLLVWTPTEAQGGSEYDFEVRVTDDGTPPLSAEATYRIRVAKGNSAPTLARLADLRVAEGSLLDLFLPGADSDLPAQTLTYSLLEGPHGMIVDPTTGRLTWTPDESTGSTRTRVTVAVTDDGEPPLAISRFFEVTVDESNQAPGLAPVPDLVAPPLRELRVALAATDPDLPANRLTVELLAAPPGAVLVGSEFRWTPPEPATTTDHRITVRVRDDGTPPLQSSGSFAIQVPAEPPRIELLEPVPGTTADERFRLSGVATDNARLARVTWTWNGTSQGQLALDAQGRFHVEGLRLRRGENRIGSVAVDTAGLEAKAEIVRTWVPERIFGLGPDLGPVTEGSRITLPVTLTGPGDVSGATLRVRFDPAILTEPEWEWTGATASAFRSFELANPATLTATFALAGSALPAGTTTLAQLVFRCRSVPADRPVQLQPEALDVFDPEGNSLGFGTDTDAVTIRIRRRSLIGDNNANARLDSGDAAVLQRYAVEPDLLELWDTALNDLNGNGSIDPGDAIKALRAAVGLDPQPPGSQAPSAAPTGPARFRLHPGQARLRPGESVSLDIVLEEIADRPFGASFVLDYPTTALRLAEGADHLPGDLPPPAASIVLWNVEPAGTDYERQSGRLHFGAASRNPWLHPTGVVARLRLTAPPDAVAGEHVVQLTQAEVSLHDGYEQKTAAGSATTILVESDSPGPPVLGAVSVRGTEVHLAVVGPTGPLVIERSTDLRHWESAAEATVEEPGEPVSIILPFQPGPGGEYFRARTLAGGPGAARSARAKRPEL